MTRKSPNLIEFDNFTDLWCRKTSQVGKYKDSHAYANPSQVPESEKYRATLERRNKNETLYTEEWFH